MAWLPELYDLSLDDWLNAADEGSGRLNGYLSLVRRNFDSVEQILALHLVKCHNAAYLHSQFFEDIEMYCLHDRELLQKTIQTASKCERRHAEADENTTLIEGPKAPEAFRCWSFAAWLRDVACGARDLLRYAEFLEENYDSVEQVINLYAVRGSGLRCFLNHMFFQDVGIVDKQHKDFFGRWFSQRCHLPNGSEKNVGRTYNVEPGAETLEPFISDQVCDHLEELRKVQENKVGDDGECSEGPCRRHRPDPHLHAVFGDDFDAWLAAVGIPRGGPGSLFHQYKRALETSKWTPDVQTLVDRYLVPDLDGHGYGLDCQLFLEMGVQCPEHRQLLEDWLLADRHEELVALSPLNAANPKYEGTDCSDVSQFQEESNGFDDPSSPHNSSSEDVACVESTFEERDSGCVDEFVSSCIRDWVQCSSNNKYVGLDFEEWLLEVDVTGSLLEKYPAMLRELYDTPDQIIRLYTESATSASWNPLFYEDANIDAAHVPLFQQWLARKRSNEQHTTKTTDVGNSESQERFKLSPTADPFALAAATCYAPTVNSIASDRQHIPETFEVID